MTDKNKDDKKPQWLKVGESTTSPVANKERKEILVDEYYVVVGFEVSLPAFKDGTHDLAISFGHAFFYIVKNNIISRLFSFGPIERSKVGWNGWGSETDPNKFDTLAIVKDGSKGRRRGTPDYGIDSLVSAFKIPLTAKQGLRLIVETDEVRLKINRFKQMYAPYMNDTCAETARDLLSSADIETPSARGFVKHSGSLSFPVAYADNPYMWHENFTKTKFKTGSFMPPPADPDTDKKWVPKIGNRDPISGFQD